MLFNLFRPRRRGCNTETIIIAPTSGFGKINGDNACQGHSIVSGTQMLASGNVVRVVRYSGDVGSKTNQKIQGFIL